MINKILKKFGLKITRDIPPDVTETFLEIFKKVRPFTMTSIERLYANYNSIDYVISNDIEGSIVECGVWKGGSAMVFAERLKQLGATNRQFYLYDTYEGMSEPTEADKDFKGNLAKDLMEGRRIDTSEDNIWCYYQLEGVVENMRSTGYDMKNIEFVKGMVEDTIPQTLPDKIAILRLDTDFYESTLHELNHLFPKLVPGGVLILDDYGHWQGAKKAVDQYIEEKNVKILLNRIDYSGRIGIKIEN